MHPPRVVLDLFGSVRPERREGQRSKGGMEEGRKGRGRRMEGGGNEGGKEGRREGGKEGREAREEGRKEGRRRREEGGRRDELNQRGSKRPLEDALKSNFGRLFVDPAPQNFPCAFISFHSHPWVFSLAPKSAWIFLSIGRMSLLKSILENLEEEEGRTASIGKVLFSRGGG